MHRCAFLIVSGCCACTSRGMRGAKMHPRRDAASIIPILPFQSGLAASLSSEGPNMAQRAIRFSETTDERIQEATKNRRFSSPTAFIRHAVEQELSGKKETLATAEERLVASIEWAKGEVLRLGRSQQALLAARGQSSQDPIDLRPCDLERSRTSRTAAALGLRRKCLGGIAE